MLGIAIICLVIPVYGVDIKESKACSGTIGLSCTIHNLTCDQEKLIVITGVYYIGNKTNCPFVGLSACHGELSVPERFKKVRFNSTELMDVLENCSRQWKCTVPAPRRDLYCSFSVIKYTCVNVDKVLPINAAGVKNTDRVTLLWTPTVNTPYSRKNFLCTVTVPESKKVSIRGLDLRGLGGNRKYPSLQNSDNCNGIYIASENKLVNCSTDFMPSMEIAEVDNQREFTIEFLLENPTLGDIWLGLRSMIKIDVECAETIVPEARTTLSNLMSLPMDSSLMTGTTPFILSSLSTDPSSMTGSVSAGSVVGGVIGGACVVALVGILVFVFLRRRKPQRDPDGTAERKETNLNLDKQHIYHEIEPANSQGNGYLTLNPDHTNTGSSSVHLKTDRTALDTTDSSNGYFTLLPGTANRGFNPGTEDKYNHTRDDKTVTGSQYDTIESNNQYFTLFPDQNNPISGNTKPTPGDEYNRVGDTKTVKGPQYDTMESACRSVKRQEIGDGDEDYDHLDGQPTSPKMESSDYYTASFTENGSSTPTGEHDTSEVVLQVPNTSTSESGKTSNLNQNAADMSPYEVAGSFLSDSPTYSVAGLS